MAYNIKAAEEQLAQTELLNNILSNQDESANLLEQQFTRSIHEEILIQLKILTKHQEIASGEIITEKDLL